MPSDISPNSLAISEDLRTVIGELGFTKLTPIQAKSIPLLLAGKDLIGQSRTGSGKTLAFSLPILNRIRLEERRMQALILCPTREIALQVTREMRRLGRRLKSLNVVPLVGGQPFPTQMQSLKKGAHIGVGTPGRILDHFRRDSFDTRSIEYVVLDEADRMLEMGFREDMEDILDKIPRDRQTVLFSATFPDSIEQMSKNFQRDPERVTIDHSDSPEAQIRQQLYKVHPEDKFPLLLWCLRTQKPESALIFCHMKADVISLVEDLTEQGIQCAGLHGDLEQSDRERVMARFRNQSTRILVATDVAARGIDVADLSLVINFDLPKPDVYLHRIGRTGRAGKEGIAISFAELDKLYKINEIETAAGISFEVNELPPAEEVDSDEDLSVATEAKMKTLYIGGGRKEKVRPGDILGALTGEAGGLDAKLIGKIEIHDHFSYVGVAAEIFDEALNSLRNGRIKGKKFRIEPVRE